jgi:hypothetical protein
MTTWRALSGAIVLAVLAASTLPLACTDVPGTNFGPAGGLQGKTLPPSVYQPKEAGLSEAGMMCPKKHADAGPPDAGADVEEGGVEEGGLPEGAATDGALPEAGLPEGAVAEAGEEGGLEGGETDGGSLDSGSGECPVSWSKDIFPKMGAAGPWQCAANACHGGGESTGPDFSGDVTSTYQRLRDYKDPYTTPPGLPYILPCSTDEAKSAIVCNLSGMSCGGQMPLTTMGAKHLTEAQVKMIRTWVGCGAIDN